MNAPDELADKVAPIDRQVIHIYARRRLYYELQVMLYLAGIGARVTCRATHVVGSGGGDTWRHLNDW